MSQKMRAGRNRTIDLTPEEKTKYRKRLLQLNEKFTIKSVTDRTINQDIGIIIDHLPDNFVDLLIIDPPYNLRKTYNSATFKKRTSSDYLTWVDEWMSRMVRLLKPDASIYVCCDWQSSFEVYHVLNKYFHVRNRITWEREKGRGSKTNWKNCSEDIWYATKSEKYKFYPERVMLKRKVVAPYKVDGKPKDWEATEKGNFRLTHPSNIWTDISIPFWSMPENTDHPTQKPEKLIAKLILASSNEGDFIFDPFLGSGTTSVVAKKLKRRYLGVEVDEDYCLLAEKRLKMADDDINIQGYSSGVFWERNSLSIQKQKLANNAGDDLQGELL